LETTESNIHAFLMEPLLKFSVEDLKKVNFDELVLLFKKWRNRWETHGLPAVVENVRQVLDIQSKWEDNVTQGHRILSNLQQLTDILQARTANHRLTPEDVYRFLKTQMKSGGKDLSDLEQATEYSVRIESDEEAVQIMTIHKSKGLEFPIVLLAELELKNKPISSHVYFSFKYSEGKYYFVKYHNKDDQTPNYKEFEGKYQSQLEEENKRLIYVGVTRAKYHVCLMVKKRKAAKNGYRIDSVGTIHQYLDALVEKNMMQDFMEREIPDLQELNLAPSSPSERTPLPNYPKPNFPDKNYHKLSYSFISGSHSSVSVPSERTYDEQSYEHFVFKALPRGLQVGHLLHHIFEFIDFTSSDQYDDMIQRALMRHMPGKQADEQFACNLKQLVDQVLGVRLNNGIPLRDVKREQRINEFEFHFPVPSDLKLLSLEYFFGNGEKTISTCKAEVKGMMNGFVDMVFEYDGKYYILDWKSNFLGDTYDDYSEDKLLQAMNASNYHLQYLIYTVALDRFLRLRLTDYCYDQHFGGVFYLFLRGIHAERPGNGVYFTRPEPTEVQRLSKWFEGAERLNEKIQGE
jgi:exodeoxyribonuclease V beta subunit